MQRAPSISSFTSSTGYTRNQADLRPSSPTEAKTSTFAKATLHSPIIEKAPPSCPNSAGSTSSLTEAFKDGINMDSPLSAKHYSTVKANRIINSTPFDLRDEDTELTASSLKDSVTSKQSDFSGFKTVGSRRIKLKTGRSPDILGSRHADLFGVKTEEEGKVRSPIKRTLDEESENPELKIQKTRGRSMTLRDKDLPPELEAYLNSIQRNQEQSILT